MSERNLAPNHQHMNQAGDGYRPEQGRHAGNQSFEPEVVTQKAAGRRNRATGPDKPDAAATADSAKDHALWPGQKDKRCKPQSSARAAHRQAASNDCIDEKERRLRDINARRGSYQDHYAGNEMQQQHNRIAENDERALNQPTLPLTLGEDQVEARRDVPGPKSTAEPVSPRNAPEITGVTQSHSALPNERIQAKELEQCRNQINSAGNSFRPRVQAHAPVPGNRMRHVITQQAPRPKCCCKSDCLRRHARGDSRCSLHMNRPASGRRARQRIERRLVRAFVEKFRQRLFLGPAHVHWLRDSRSARRTKTDRSCRRSESPASDKRLRRPARDPTSIRCAQKLHFSAE